MFVIFNESNFEVRQTFMKNPIHSTNKLNEIKERENDSMTVFRGQWSQSLT